MMVSSHTSLAPLALGISVEGRPLIVDRFGTEGPKLLIIGAIHGNERSAVTLGERLRWRLLGGWAERHGVRVALMGSANPDGIERGTRHNARDIDLNRHFPSDNFESGGEAGSSALTEPEARAIVDLVEAYAPDAVLSLHCCEPMLDHDGPAREWAEAMHRNMPRDLSFPLETLGARPGSMGSWVGLDRQIPIVTLELAAADTHDLFEQFEAVEQALEGSISWLRTQHTTSHRTDETWEGRTDAHAPHVGCVPHLSEGGLPLRVESTHPIASLESGDCREVMVLLGGLDNTPQSLHVAEHLRRLAHVQSAHIGRPVVTISSINPDGVAVSSPQNGAGLDVVHDLAADRPRTSEARLVHRWIECLKPRMVVGVEHDRHRDSITCCGDETLCPSNLRRESDLQEVRVQSAWMEPCLERGSDTVVRLGVQHRCGEGRRAPDSLVSPERFGDPVRRLIED